MLCFYSNRFLLHQGVVLVADDETFQTISFTNTTFGVIFVKAIILLFAWLGVLLSTILVFDLLMTALSVIVQAGFKEGFIRTFVTVEPFDLLVNTLGVIIQDTF